MTSVVQINRQKINGNREALGMRLCSFGRAVENGGTFHTFLEEEIAELLPKTSQEQNEYNLTDDR